MTLVTKMIGLNAATDTEFRDFVTKFRAGFIDLGWVRTSDTGQIDPTTVLKPTGTNVVMGYDIFRPADALQATAPFFVKIEYGSGSGLATYNTITVSMGTGTNGAGTLIGNVSARQWFSSGAADSTLRPCTFAGGPNRIAIFMFEGAAVAATVIIVFERSHADDGSDTGERMDMVTAYGPSASIGFQQVPSSGPVVSMASSVPVLVPYVGGGQKGTDVGVFPVFPCNQGPLRNPLIGLLVYYLSDISTYSDVPVTMYGTSRTYRAHADRTSSSWTYQSALSNFAPMILVS